MASLEQLFDKPVTNSCKDTSASTKLVIHPTGAAGKMASDAKCATDLANDSDEGNDADHEDNLDDLDFMSDSDNAGGFHANTESEPLLKKRDIVGYNEGRNKFLRGPIIITPCEHHNNIAELRKSCALFRNLPPVESLSPIVVWDDGSLCDCGCEDISPLDLGPPAFELPNAPGCGFDRSLSSATPSPHTETESLTEEEAGVRLFIDLIVQPALKVAGAVEWVTTSFSKLWRKARGTA